MQRTDRIPASSAARSDPSAAAGRVVGSFASDGLGSY